MKVIQAQPAHLEFVVPLFDQYRQFYKQPSDMAGARRFLGEKSTIAIAEVNARNMLGIVRAARGCQLIVNASASVFNQIVMRAALRLRAHYVDLSSHLTRNPFKAEQFSYAKRFEEKNRTALINTGAAPGLTNLLAKRAAEMLDEVHSVHIRLYESTESDDPISQWSPEVSFDEAISSPRVYRDGKFRMEKRSAELEKFRFPDPNGNANVVLAAQDEVAVLRLDRPNPYLKDLLLPAQVWIGLKLVHAAWEVFYVGVIPIVQATRFAQTLERVCIDTVEQGKMTKDLAVLIGPEGGFAADERAALLKAPNVVRLALGPRIMRADTAAVAALALVAAGCGSSRARVAGSTSLGGAAATAWPARFPT